MTVRARTDWLADTAARRRAAGTQRTLQARAVVTQHVDSQAVAAALAARDEQRALVVTESVFSVDGDVAPLTELQRICRAYDAMLVVDEAHALGVCGPGGRGLVTGLGLDRE